MSSILEALEKADADRVRGAGSEERTAHRAVRDRHFILRRSILLVVGLVLLNSLFLWWYLRGVSEEEAPPVAPRAPKKEVSAPAQPPMVETPAAPASAKAPAASVSLRDQLKRSALPTSRPLIEEAQIKVKPVSVSAPAPAGIVSPTGDEQPVEGPALHSAGVARVGETALSVTASGERLSPTSEAETTGETEPKPVVTSMPEKIQQPEEQIPLVWELPQALREKVLRLKSSVHVYHERPAERFVIIRMRRYGEGDSLPPDGFRLRRIDQAGMVIDYGEGLARLPRP